MELPTLPHLPPRTTPPGITVRDLTVSYDQTPVLRGVSFALPRGCLVGIIGPNGAGKTTLMKAILGLIKPEAGSIAVGGVTTSRPGPRVAYVPQHDSFNRRFPASVFDVVLMGRTSQIGWVRRPGAADRRAANEALERVNMADLAHRPITMLSGGQQQRVFLARALAQEAELLLLDEPISGVDRPTQDVILTILRGLADEGRTLLLTTHDLHCNMEYFDGLLALNRTLVAIGPTELVLRPQVLAETYGTQVVLSDGTGVTLV